MDIEKSLWTDDETKFLDACHDGDLEMAKGAMRRLQVVDRHTSRPPMTMNMLPMPVGSGCCRPAASATSPEPAPTTGSPQSPQSPRSLRSGRSTRVSGPPSIPCRPGLCAVGSVVETCGCAALCTFQARCMSESTMHTLPHSPPPSPQGAVGSTNRCRMGCLEPQSPCPAETHTKGALPSPPLHGAPTSQGHHMPLE